MIVFDENPKKFFDVLGIEDLEGRISAFDQSLTDIVLCELIRYGVFKNPEMIPGLQRLFHDVVLQQFSLEERWEIFRRVTSLLGKVDWISSIALMPFVYLETDPQLVASAVIDYASLLPLVEDDEMTGPRDVIQMIEGGSMGSTAGAFGGLLYLGDPRVCRLLWPIRDLLDKDEVATALSCSTGYLYSSTIEFQLEWLQGLEGEPDDGLFGVITSHLARSRRLSKLDQVIGGKRPFPVNSDEDGTEQRARPTWSRDEYALRIAPTLYALERSEPPVRVMPHVLLAWDLEPRTPMSEAAPLDDRFPSISPAMPGIAHSNAPEILEIEEDWADGEGQILLIWGILNPDGPTLYALGFRKIEGVDCIFFRWLHMLGGRTYVQTPITGKAITYADIYEGARLIAAHLSARGEPTPFATIPDFLMAAGQDEAMVDMAEELIAADAAAEADWGKSLAYVNTFHTDFFSKAGCEIRAVYDALRARHDLSEAEQLHLNFMESRYGRLPFFANAKPLLFRSAPLSPELYEEWWQTINQAEWQGAAIRTLGAMWRGASSMLSGLDGMRLTPFEHVVEFLSSYKFSPE